MGIAAVRISADQVRRTGAALPLYAGAFLILVATAAASYIMDLPVATFMQDPAANFGGHPFTGLVSNLGVLAWCATAVVCTFTYGLRRESGGDRELLLMIGWGGVLSAVWMFDDLFMLHELIVPQDLGIPQPVILATYGAATLLFLARFRAVFGRTRLGLLATSLLFLGLSVALDLVSTGPNWHHLFEDGAKFMGIVGWLAYFVSASWLAIEDGAARGTSATEADTGQA